MYEERQIKKERERCERKAKKRLTLKRGRDSERDEKISRERDR